MITEPEPAIEHSEAFDTLLARVGRKSPKIPAEILVRHVMRVVPPQEWPARLEAMDALLRRLESVKNDALKIDARPGGGHLLGPYATKRRRTDVRPYSTVLEAVEPIGASCDCPDFLKNSLGACKHILTVLEHLYSRPRLLQKALKEREAGSATPPTGLRWDPIRPLTGAGDWLARVHWLGPPEAKGRRATRGAEVTRLFRRDEDGTLVVRRSFQGDPTKRLALVEALLKLLPAGDEGHRPDPALRVLLIGERNRLRWVVKQALSSAELRTAFQGLKRTLYPYQREGVGRFLAAGRLLLADDMGLGKTAQAIAACEILWRTRRIRRGLIIAPASLKPQWAREWANFSDLPIRVVDGTPAERQAIYDARRSGFLIINYEQLLRDLDMVRRWGPDLVVLDEAQRIKNWATKTALSVKGLTPPHRLVLTGTPMENRIEELASIVEWVDDMALEPKWRLNPLHSVYDDGRREVRGVRHLDTLRERLKPCMVRRVRQDVLDQLPSRTDIRVPVEMTEAQLEEHNALNQPIAQLVMRSKTRPLTQAQFLRLMSLLTTQRIISNGLVQLRFEELWPAIRPCAPEESVIQGLSAPKLLELKQLIRQLMLGQGRKVVIFSQWRRMLTLAHWAVSDLLAENGLRAGFFTGAEGQRRRTQNIVEFHDDPDHRLLFASDAGGVGLNLQHAANCVINLELPWNPAVLEQRIGRIYRLGQKLPIDVYNLVCEVGIESRIAGLVGTKQAFFKGLFDGESDSVQFEHSGSFLSKVEKIIEESLPTSDLVPAGQEDDPSEFADLISDDEVGDPYEELVDAADESRDQAEPQPESILVVEAEQASPPRPADVEDRLDVPSRPTTTTTEEVRQLFSRLRIRREVDGRVIIEAPPEAASTLGALFEGMAALLQSMATSPEPEKHA